MKLSEFHYDLPKELIAQYPLKKRDTSRLMVLNRESQSITENIFQDITKYIQPGDCLVLNDTRVMPVRLYGKRKTGAKVEIFLLNPGSKKLHALVKPSKRITPGEKVELEGGIEATIFGTGGCLRFVSFDKTLDQVLKTGHMPLPPYITRKDNLKDRKNYQTVYAYKDGATASPTAGLHFTRKLLEKIKEKGVSIVYVTLHIGYGTFQPVTAKTIEEHLMHAEYYQISEETRDVINRTKSSGARILAVGTSSVRALEASSTKQGKVTASSGQTDLFIYPGYKRKIVDCIITNFHLPQSTLLMLVSAFAGKDFIFKAYKKAIEEKYRFFSYGDAMLIL